MKTMQYHPEQKQTEDCVTARYELKIALKIEISSVWGLFLLSSSFFHIFLRRGNLRFEVVMKYCPEMNIVRRLNPGS